jgi:hypothetical protein
MILDFVVDYGKRECCGNDKRADYGSSVQAAAE